MAEKKAPAKKAPAKKAPAKDEQNFVPPAISWTILGGELVLAIAIALICWL